MRKLEKYFCSNTTESIEILLNKILAIQGFLENLKNRYINFTLVLIHRASHAHAHIHCNNDLKIQIFSV